MCSGRIFPYVKLDAVGDGEPVPAKSHVIVVSDGEICSGTQRRSECERDFALKRITGDVAHLFPNRVQALSFALPNLYGQQLKEMAISVRRAGARSFGMIQ